MLVRFGSSVAYFLRDKPKPVLSSFCPRGKQGVNYPLRQNYNCNCYKKKKPFLIKKNMFVSLLFWKIKMFNYITNNYLINFLPEVRFGCHAITCA